MFIPSLSEGDGCWLEDEDEVDASLSLPLLEDVILSHMVLDEDGELMETI